MNAFSTKTSRFAGRKLALSVLAAMAFAGSAQAAVMFEGSGYNPETKDAGQSASARFSISTDANEVETLTLTLTNTTGITKAQGDALTGILFDLGKSSAKLSLASITLTKGSALWSDDDSTVPADKVNLTGSWTDQLASSPRLTAGYGVSTTGFNSEFKGGSIYQGNSSADFGIVGAKTLPGDLSGAKFPFVQNSVTFRMNVAGALDESDLSNVRFLFGTDGTGVVGGSKVPEPATLVLLGLAFGVSRLVRRHA